MDTRHSGQLVESAYYYTPDGEQYALVGGRRTTMRWQGLGAVPVDWLRDKGPFQDGTTVRDYRLPERIIDWELYLGGTCRDSYWSQFGHLNDMLRPNRADEAGRLLVITSEGEEREIFARILEGPTNDYDAGSGTRDSDQSQRLRFLCSDPIWRNPTQQTVSFTLGITSQLVFPITFPILFGTEALDGAATITYLGTYKSYPVITIQGPLNRPTIRNDSTGEEIGLDYNVAVGEVVTVDLFTNNQNVKTVTNNLGANLIGTISNPNDLATFHLEVAPRVAGGVNDIKVSGSGALAGETNVTLTYYTRYLGVPK